MHTVRTWWRHQMETFSALLAIYAGNSPVPGEFPAQRPVTRSFDVFFDLHLNKRLSKQSWGWWFETLSRPLWRHRKDFAVCCSGVVPGPANVTKLEIVLSGNVSLRQGLKSYWETRRDNSMKSDTIRDDTWNVLNMQNMSLLMALLNIIKAPPTGVCQQL